MGVQSNDRAIDVLFSDTSCSLDDHTNRVYYHVTITDDNRNGHLLAPWRWLFCYCIDDNSIGDVLALCDCRSSIYKMDVS